MSSSSSRGGGPGFAGRLLIAPPALRDPNFAGSVVAVLLHGEQGAFGLVLNRPNGTPVGGLLQAWADRCVAPAEVFSGGPVQRDGLVGLGLLPAGGVGGVGRSEHDPGDAGDVADADADDADGPGLDAVMPGLVSLDLSLPPEDGPDGLRSVRVFAGYSGWGAGQLEGEIAAGGWIVAPLLPDDLFTADPNALRRRVLRRQGGQLAWLALHPEEPACN